MVKICTIITVIISSINVANAYCRGNTIKCKQVQLNQREKALEKQLAKSTDASLRQELSEEIEAIQYEAKRLEEKANTTASNE
jgi:tRNA A37 N6-isopentenylltransferase MiaA